MTQHATLHAAPDDGYTRLCTQCNARHGINPFKRGKPRELELIPCKDCVSKPVTKYEARFGKFGRVRG